MASAGAAVVVEDSELDGERVRKLAGELIEDDERLTRMGEASAGLAMPDAAERVAAEVLSAIGGRAMSREAWAGRKLHFIAIGGAGMSGLALVAHRLGAIVTGSDRAESSYMDRLRAAGLDPVVGHDRGPRPAGRRGGRLDRDRPTTIPSCPAPASAARRELHRGALLAELCAEGRLIAVAGTHGKTTTTGMIVHALRELGADPTFFIGGELPGAGDEGAPANAGLGTGEWIVAEADESDASFLELRPDVAVVTNVELDHHARWSSRAELSGAFAEFAAPAAGVVRGDDYALDAVVPPGRGVRDVHRDRSPGPLRSRSAFQAATTR